MFSVPDNAPAIGGIVFDMDGVLVLSSEIHRQAFAEILNPLGITFDYDRFAGQRTVDVFRALLTPSSGPPPAEEQLLDLARRKSARSRQLMTAARGSLAPNCVKVLTGLADTFSLGLASSGSRESVAAFLEFSQLRPIFRAVFSGDDVQHAKPHPELFERAIAGLGLSPERCVVVEDSVSGVEAAQRAGAHPIGMGLSRAAALTSAGATCVIDSLEELPALLGRQLHHT